MTPQGPKHFYAYLGLKSISHSPRNLVESIPKNENQSPAPATSCNRANVAVLCCSWPEECQSGAKSTFKMQMSYDLCKKKVYLQFGGRAIYPGMELLPAR